MLRTDLIELLNSRQAWALVGSGTSVDAGLPTWNGLLTSIVEGLPPPTKKTIQNDATFNALLKQPHVARSFSRLERLIGRDHLESAVADQLQQPTRESQLTSLITDWPFAGYLTTNYDGLLETALNKGPQAGWSSVGNTDSELRKLSGHPAGVVWHVHGGISLPKSDSTLILTEADYDNQYLEDTRVVQTLRALISFNRLVIVGFSLSDPELLRILKRVGRLANPTRPIFAFMPELPGGDHQLERTELLEVCNIDVIPYRVSNGSHRALQELLETYSAFTLRRSLQFGQPLRQVPSYNPEATGLLLYNKLAIARTPAHREDVILSLLRARLLSLLAETVDGISIEEFAADLDARTALIQGSDGTNTSMETLAGAIASLVADSLVEASATNYSLTASGKVLVLEQAAAAERMRQQFEASLSGRAGQMLDDKAGVGRVAQAASAFISECITTRSLGVALSQAGQRPNIREFHIVALLQALPQFLSSLTNDSEAISLVRLIQAVFARPTEIESVYIGLSLQAQFGTNLLGYDPSTLRARIDAFRKTTFLIDSNTLIPLLARSSPGYDSACALIEQVQSAGAQVVTTEMLAVEVAEHAQWAITKVERDSGNVNTRTLETALGRAGERSNAFLEGFLVETGQGSVLPDFREYLRQTLGALTQRSRYGRAEISAALERVGVRCAAFEEWDGFNELLWPERDELQKAVTAIRKERDTYRHDRQVRAEAEALIVVNGVRAGSLTLDGRSSVNCFFVSNTRILDQVDKTHAGITMKPEAVLQWSMTLVGCTARELRSLMSGLVWELSERNLSIVDHSTLVVTFGPLMTAAQSQLGEELDRHNNAIAETFGAQSIQAFRDVSAFDAPVVLESIYAQRARALAEELEATRAALARSSAGRLGERERTELEVLRSKEKFRSQRGRSRQRAAQSKRSKRRGKGSK